MLMETIKNTKKQMEKLLDNDETLEDILEKSKKLNKTMKEDYISKNRSRKMTDEETIEEKAVEYVLATFYEDYSTEEKKDILKENSRYFRDKVNLFIKAYDMGQNDEFEFNNRMAIRNAKKMKELEAQIEKMKNVGNCKYTMQCSDWVKHKIKDDGIKACLNCIKWELAE